MLDDFRSGLVRHMAIAVGLVVVSAVLGTWMRLAALDDAHRKLITDPSAAIAVLAGWSLVALAAAVLMQLAVTLAGWWVGLRTERLGPQLALGVAIVIVWGLVVGATVLRLDAFPALRSAFLEHWVDADYGFSGPLVGSLFGWQMFLDLTFGMPTVTTAGLLFLAPQWLGAALGHADFGRRYLPAGLQ